MTSVRALASLEELRAAADVLERIWGVRHVTAEMLRALAWAGNPVLGAFDQESIVGVSAGFVGPEPELHLHSHITGVLPGHEHTGIGHALKVEQRQWCLRHGIDLVCWTFDPMIARNGYFNIAKLGATASRILPDFYGVVVDDITGGEHSDRLEACWRVRSPRVGRALAGQPVWEGGVARTVRVPTDYLELRRRDPGAALAERERVRLELEEAFAAGLVAVDFARDDGYVLAESPPS